jgi:hypothetical protein
MLRDLLPAYGITTIVALARRTGMSHQQCWNLWHGYAGIGKAMMQRLHDRLGMSLDELMAIDPPTPPKPRGRPRKPRRETDVEDRHQ